jgi:hypothetical protein
MPSIVLGPLEYIPSFVARKKGEEEIKYDLPEMEGLPQRDLWDHGLSGASHVIVSKIGRIFQG